MLNAKKLIKEQQVREIKKHVIYDKIYSMVEKKIALSSRNNNYYTWYELPEFFLGLPLYSIDNCQEYIQIKLKENGFETEFFPPKILLVKWFPS